MSETKHYLFRTTTAQLQGHLDHIEESGDRILAVQFMGGENRWVIVCRKGGETQPLPPLAMREPYRQGTAV